MTYIEFLDSVAAENICACLAGEPERVVLVGDCTKLLKKHAERYAAIFPNVEFVCKCITKNNLRSIIGALSEIVEMYERCVFDLTGGDELYLVAIGIICERYAGRGIQMHRFNIRGGRIIDCDGDGATILKGAPLEMSIEDNIRVYGGEVVYDTEKAGATHRWRYDDAFKREIDTMWDICRADVKVWNYHIGILAAAESGGNENGELTTIRSFDRRENRFRNFAENREIAGRLRSAGLIDFTLKKNSFSITYKNEQVKRCLTKAGQALEMKIYSAAKELVRKDGTPYYNDVMNGVCIDWDGRLHSEKGGRDTENEIDVMLMSGIIPIFISCKNGFVEMDELYKLNTVAHRFGNKYAKKVLVATALDRAGDFADHFRQRASDMGIRVIEGIGKMDDEQLAKTLISLRD